METVLVNDEIILNQIFFIRGVKVMLDRDLAELYGVETKVLKQAVRRNIKRFPSDFMFELKSEEFKILRSQYVTSKSENRGGAQYLPFCFTEPGIAMLSSVLKSEKAINVNIHIIRIFIKMRQALLDNADIRIEIEKINKKLCNQDKNIEVVFSYLEEIYKKDSTSPVRKQIGYKPDNSNALLRLFQPWPYFG